MRILVLLAAFSVGCASTSSSSVPTDAAVDGLTETAALCPGAKPTDCVTGAKGRACADARYERDCSAGEWVCKAGTIPAAECGCAAGPGTPPRLPGDACPVADAGVEVGDAGSCDCISSRLGWGWDGGFVAYVERSAIAPCRTYTRDRTSPSGGAPLKTCTRELLPCGAGDAIDIGDVRAALANADVVAAFAGAPVLYGTDPRAFDGSVFRVELGGKVIEVGYDCGGTAGCKPAPPGVKSLVALLKALDTAQLALSPCKEAFLP